jgi:signal transduction histidine kinase
VTARRLLDGFALGILATGFGVALVAGVGQGLPLVDVLQLVGLSAGAALLAGVACYVALEAIGPARASLAAQAAAVALVAVVGTGVGTWAAARAMFVSSHDLAALLVVLAGAATIGVLGAAALGRRVERASRELGIVTRRIGAGRNEDRSDDWGRDRDRDGDHAGDRDGARDRDRGSGGRDAVGGRPGRPGRSARPGPSAELAALSAEIEDMGRRLAASRERERTLEGARRQLVAWVSHDLRTPLAGIRAMTEALTDGVVTDPAEVARYHATVQAQVERLTRLVDDLFELSRIQADAVTLTLGEASLADVVSDALASARPLAEGRGVRLDGRVAGPPPRLPLAGDEMGRVLQNLLDNAIRHTPAGGAVTVEVRAEADGASVTVADGCGGIPDQDIDRVFDLAYRGDAARSPGDRGAGLGLAIARGLVEAHAGEIDVANAEDGCRFTVRLPGTPPPPGPPAPAPPPPRPTSASLPD